MILNRLIITLILIAGFKILAGQNVEVTVSAPSAVEVDEQFRLTFSVNANISGFQAPDMSALRIYTGPNQSTSSSIQIINGKVSQSMNTTLTYIVSAPNEGKFEFGPATVNVDGKSYTSKPFTIEVVKGTSQTRQKPQNQTSQQSEQIPEGEIADQELFIRVNLDRKTVFLGEHIVATIKIYSRVDLANINDFKFPGFQGFYTQEVNTPDQISLVRENVNGKIYNTGLLKQLIIYPQRSGDITIDPAEILCIVRQRVNRQRSIFDDFFGAPYQTIQKKISSQPVTVHIKPLPANKPAGFSGAVGQFKIHAVVDKNEVNTNEAISLKVKVSGKGNLKLIEPLKFNFPADFEVYDPKVDLSVSNDLTGTSGSKTFDYLIIPRHPGDFEIPSSTFSYFDPASGGYLTLITPEFNIKVNRGADDQTGTVVSSFSKEDIKLIGSDIHYIQTGNLMLFRKGRYIIDSAYFWLIYLGSFITFVILMIISRDQIRKNADIARVKNRKAARMAQKRLKRSREFLNKNIPDKFYEEIQKALWGYFSDKLSIPFAELTRDKIVEKLNEYHIDQSVIDELINLLNNAEFARFAPSSIAGDMEIVAKQAFDMIVRMDQLIRK